MTIIFMTDFEDFLEARVGKVYIGTATTQDQYPPRTNFYVNVCGFDGDKNPIMIRALATWAMTFDEHRMGLEGQYLKKCVDHIYGIVKNLGPNIVNGTFATTEFELGILPLPEKEIIQ